MNQQINAQAAPRMAVQFKLWNHKIIPSYRMDTKADRHVRILIQKQMDTKAGQLFVENACFKTSFY